MTNSEHPQNPVLLLSCDGELHGEDTPENREFVRRIEACLKACDGLSIEDLENGIIKQMCQTIAEVIPLLEERQILVAKANAEAEKKAS